MLVDPAAFARERIREAELAGRRCVVPLYERGRRGEAHLVGSSVLVEVPRPGFGKPIWFWITAAHVSDVARTGVLHVSGAERGELDLLHRVVVGEVTSVVVPQGGERREDRFDIAFAEVDRSRLNPEYRAVPIAQVVVDEREDPYATYVAQGYPGSRNKHPFPEEPVKPQAYSPVLRPALAADVGDNGHDPAFHVALSYNRRRTLDLAEYRVGVAPKLNGMSGGPIWGFPSAVALGLSTFRLVALFTESYPNRGVVMGTRMDTVVEALRMRRPDLGSALPQVRMARVTIQLKPPEASG